MGEKEVAYRKFVLERSRAKTDIAAHMPRLFAFVLGEDEGGYPRRRILELGVRWGESTLAFLCGADLVGGFVLSCDITPCSVARKRVEEMGLSHRWLFVVADDRKFLPSLHGQFDLILIDTSHELEHTLFELRESARLLAKRKGALVLLHDYELSSVREAVRRFLAETDFDFDLEVFSESHGLAALRLQDWREGG